MLLTKCMCEDNEREIQTEGIVMKATIRGVE